MPAIHRHVEHGVSRCGEGGDQLFEHGLSTTTDLIAVTKVEMQLERLGKVLRPKKVSKLPHLGEAEFDTRDALLRAVAGEEQSVDIATHSGQPNLLGWPGHERQWRGGGEEMGTRAQDIERLYTSGSWSETTQILSRYNVRYIYLGVLERTTYQVNEAKFNRYLQPVFQQGQATIYEVPELNN